MNKIILHRNIFLVLIVVFTMSIFALGCSDPKQEARDNIAECRKRYPHGWDANDPEYNPTDAVLYLQCLQNLEG